LIGQRVKVPSLGLPLQPLADGVAANVEQLTGFTNL